MTLQQAAQGMKPAFEEMKEAIKVETENAATVGLKNIRERIQEDGKDSTGQAWKPYTQKYRDFKIKTKGAKYASGLVDFTLNAQMWPSIGIVESKISDTLAVVVVSGRDTDTNLKLEGNEKKRPGILKMSAKEIEIAEEDFQIEIEKKIEQIMIEYR